MTGCPIFTALYNFLFFPRVILTLLPRDPQLAVFQTDLSRGFSAVWIQNTEGTLSSHSLQVNYWQWSLQWWNALRDSPSVLLLGDLVASCSDLLAVFPFLSGLVLIVPFTCLMCSAFFFGGPGLMFSSKTCNNFTIHVSAWPLLYWVLLLKVAEWWLNRLQINIYIFESPVGSMVVFCFHPSYWAPQLLGNDTSSTVCFQKSHNTLLFLWDKCARGICEKDSI